MGKGKKLGGGQADEEAHGMDWRNERTKRRRVYKEKEGNCKGG